MSPQKEKHKRMVVVIDVLTLILFVIFAVLTAILAGILLQQ